MTVTSVESFVQSLRTFPALLPDQAEGLDDAICATFADPQQLARHLVRLGWLTHYQAGKLLHGRGDDLLLGQYLILDKIGEGGMGKVYKAVHRRMGRLVALKVVRPDLLSSPRTLTRFRREARSAARLAHPNIVRLYDADEVAGRYFLALEYVDGPDLTRLVRQKGPLPVGQACDFVRQAALGLAHAHEQGLIHRDIKPANLLVTRADRAPRPGDTRGGKLPPAGGLIKILDMGLVRPLPEDPTDMSATSVTQDGTVVGTPDYMAPEQAKDSRSVDPRADLYSLGCTLYFLLTGQPPFRGATVMETLLAHQSEPVPLARDARPDVPPVLDEILGRLMAKQPRDRFASAGEVARTLAPLCSAGAAPPALGSSVCGSPATREISRGRATPPDLDAGPVEPSAATAERPAATASPFAFDEAPVASLRDPYRGAGTLRGWIFGGIGAATVLLALALALFSRRPPGPVRPAPPPRTAEPAPARSRLEAPAAGPSAAGEARPARGAAAPGGAGGARGRPRGGAGPAGGGATDSRLAVRARGPRPRSGRAAARGALERGRV